jgi:glyoxylase I family protein
MRLPVINVKHVVSVDFLTRNMTLMIDFYHGVLGIPFFLPWNGDEDVATLDLGDLIICLMRTKSPASNPLHTMNASEDPSGFDSIALKVDNLEEAMAALEGKVRWINPEPVETRFPNGMYFKSRATRDPDGNLVYIQESHVVRSC